MKSFKLHTDTSSEEKPAPETAVADKKDTQSLKKLLKWAGIITAILLGIAFWYIAIPAVVIWYLYKRDKRLSPTMKKRVSIGVAVFFLILGSLTLYANRGPSLTLTEPVDATTIQAERITVAGTVLPKDSTVTVNDIPVEVGADGHFSYEVRLKDESNPLTIRATRGSKEDSKTVTVTRIFTEEEKAAIRAAEIESAKEAVRKEIASLDSFDSTNFRGSLAAMQVELALFEAYAQTIAKHKRHPDPGVKALAEQLEAKVSRLQVQEFPRLRKAYADLMAQEMWENDMEVSVAGSGNKTIVLTAAMFASNKNIGEAHATLKEALGLFRFTRANYKWFEYDSEYTYYELESHPDAKVIPIGQ